MPSHPARQERRALIEDKKIGIVFCGRQARAQLNENSEDET